MIDLGAIFIAGLATWRLVYMLQEENGPKGLFARIRAYIASKSNGEIGDFLDGYMCMYCLSVWIAFIFSLFLYSTWKIFLLQWLAISAIAIFTNLFNSKLEQ